MNNKIIPATHTADGKIVPGVSVLPEAPELETGEGLQFHCIAGVASTGPLFTDEQVNMMMSAAMSGLVRQMNDPMEEALFRAHLQKLNQGVIFELIFVCRPALSKLDASRLAPEDPLDLSAPISE